MLYFGTGINKNSQINNFTNFEKIKNPTLVPELRIFRKFLHDPFSWNNARSVNTNTFFAGQKIKRDAYLMSQKILGFTD